MLLVKWPRHVERALRIINPFGARFQRALMAFIASRRRQLDRSRRASLLATLRATQSPYNFQYFRIPFGDCGERFWMTAARVAARALNQEQVLTKFIAELFDFKIAHARIVQKPTMLSPSSSQSVGLQDEA
jgi:hypothetical protein